MLKNTKFYVAVALLVQAVASIVACIVLAVKKKAAAAVAFLAVGGVSGAAGAYLMGECIEENEFEEYCDGDCENCAELAECEALEAELAAEEEAVEEVAEEAVVEEVEADFALEGEPFARIAEANDNE